MLLPLAALLGVAAALPGRSASGPPPGSHNAPAGLPFPDIATVTAVPQDSFTSYATGGLKRLSAGNQTDTLQKRWDCSRQPTLTWGDHDDGGHGIAITNAGNDWRGFYIYHNSCDSVPWKYIWIEKGKTQWVSVPAGFEGRVQRGVDSTMLNGSPQPLGSWLEVSWDPDGTGWVDVSLIRGCDGGALVWDPSDGNKWKGFTQWILDGAPEGAYDMKNDGQWVIKATEGANAVVNTIPRDWVMQKVGADFVYVDDDHAKPVISTRGGRWATYWPEGRA